MDNIIRNYICENYLVVFSTMDSYKIYDTNNKKTLGFKTTINELILIFGENSNITKILSSWTVTKVQELKMIVIDINNKSLTREQLNQKLIDDFSTQKCT